MKSNNFISRTAAFLYKFDMFAAPAPSFNIRGKTQVTTLVGSFISLAVMTLTMLFAFLKLQFMLLRKNPNVMMFEDEEGTDPSMRYNIIDNDFMMAFSASSWDNGARADSYYI